MGSRRVAIIVTGICRSLGALVIALVAFNLSQDPSHGNLEPGSVCQAAHVAITLTDTGGAGPTIGGFMRFKNDGRNPCRLQGWPKVTAVSATGRTMVAERHRTTPLGPFRVFTQAPRLIVRPGQSAFAALVGSDVGPHLQCPSPYHTLSVRLPGSSSTVTLSAWLPGLHSDLLACTPLQVSMILPPTVIRLYPAAYR